MAAVPLSTFAYRLTVLTHGQSSTLAASVGSFIANADPLPRETIIVVDGPENQAVREVADVMERARLSTRVVTDARQRGFCEATKRAWTLGSDPKLDYVLHWEGDFKLNGYLDVQALADVLDREENMAQMVLLRQAVNGQEIEAGGLREARPGQFEERSLLGHKYTVQREYLSTNPFLATTLFMRNHPWPDYTERCEGLFGFDLKNEGWEFGSWGGLDDGPQVEHIGVRDGMGY